jgi:hypothetical protein
MSFLIKAVNVNIILQSWLQTIQGISIDKLVANWLQGNNMAEFVSFVSSFTNAQMQDTSDPINAMDRYRKLVPKIMSALKSLVPNVDLKALEGVVSYFGLLFMGEWVTDLDYFVSSGTASSWFLTQLNLQGKRSLNIMNEFLSFLLENIVLLISGSVSALSK